VDCCSLSTRRSSDLTQYGNVHYQYLILTVLYLIHVTVDRFSGSQQTQSYKRVCSQQDAKIRSPSFLYNLISAMFRVSLLLQNQGPVIQSVGVSELLGPFFLHAFYILLINYYYNVTLTIE